MLKSWKSTKAKRILLFIGVAFYSLTGAAQSGGGQVFAFLSMPQFAPSVVLGNTALLHPGPSVGFAAFNPLLLSDSSAKQVEFSVGQFGEGISQLQGTYGLFIKERPLVFSAKALNYGTFDATDIWGNAEGTFRAADVSFSLGTRLARWNQFDVGANLKVVNGVYEAYSSWAIATDLIARWSGAEHPDLALVLQNAGVQLSSFSNQREPLPLDLILVISDKLKYMPLRWAFAFDRLHQPYLGYDDPNLVTVDPLTGETIQNSQSLLNLAMRHVSASAEFMPTQRLHLLVGYSFRRQFEMALPLRRTSNGFNLGASLYFDKFQLHYARELRSVVGTANTLSLVLR